MSCFQPFVRLPSTRSYTSRGVSQRNRAVEVKLTSSIIPRAEEINGPMLEIDSLSFNSKMTDQTNVIGILGGNHSLSFAKKLVDQATELPIALCTDPALSNDLLLLNRSSLPFLSGKPEGVNIDESSIVKKLRQKRAFLEKSGASCIVMPCHVSHYWYGEIKEGCSLPFLHMGETVAKELEVELRPMETGSSVYIGVLATNTTLVTRMYQEELENKGFRVVLPDKNTMKYIVAPAVEALSKEDLEGARNLLKIALHILLIKAVNRIIIACDELRELLPPDDPLWRKCIDPMDALARSAIMHAHSAKKES